MIKTGIILVIVAIIALFIGMALSSNPSTASIGQEIRDTLNLENTTEFRIPSQREFVPANISISATRVVLRNGCYAIDFQVTDDQAFSIAHGLDGSMSARPLTHDIIKDIVDDFGIKILAIRIERFGEDIYYARMFAHQGDKVLDVDMRPSDAIALSLRTHTTLHINQSMLHARGTNVCTQGG